MRLLDPWTIKSRVAPCRVVFGPHVTNLGVERAISDRHVAYYQRRAAGGCGLIVTEVASVDDSDWPYERAPLAADCANGWAATATAVHAAGALAVAGLGHAGGQGSSAYHQRELWAPSRVPEVATREVPKWMEERDITTVIEGFARSSAIAREVGLDGVEINAGQHSLIRQFLSGLTNHRSDDWGTDRTRFARAVIDATRVGAGDGLVGLRLSCDELAPWAGITPDAAIDIARALAPLVDYLVVVRGSIYTPEKERPDFHEPAGFNIDLCRRVRDAIGATTDVVLQGSVVDTSMANDAIESGAADAVEMTRAQIADPDLVAKSRRGETPRPCLRCNQACQVRDVRNPIVSCVVEPSAGHERDDPDWYARAQHSRAVVVAGAGIAGLETARTAAIRGHRVRVLERLDEPGGVAARVGPGGPLVEWLLGELVRLGVPIEMRVSSIDTAAGEVLVATTGSRPGERSYSVAPDAIILDVLEAVPSDGPIALWDPIGGPIAVALAERLGPRAVLVTPDQLAGNELSRTGDLAPANVRLQQAGVRIERRAILRAVHAGSVEIEDRFSGAMRTVEAVALVDCGFRLPDESVAAVIRAGDCVAPRTILEAVLEGRRAALAVDGAP